MTTPVTRVAVVGLGRHALKTVLPAIDAAPTWELAGVVSARAEAASAVAAGQDVEAYPDLAAAIESDGVDAVYLATVPSLHAAACHQAIGSGVRHVVCEKPLGVNAHEISELVAAARGSSTVLYEVMAYQHHPQFAAIERLLDSDQVGGLVHGYARFSYPFMPEGDYRYRSAEGGGSLLDAGVYPLSMASRMLGDSDLTVQGTLFRGQWDVDVAGSATLTDPLGRTFQCSWGMGSAYANIARLVGTAGSIEVARPFSKPGSFAEPLTLVGGWGERSAVEYEPTDQFVSMLEDIARNADDADWRGGVLRDIEHRWSVLTRLMDDAVRVG